MEEQKADLAKDFDKLKNDLKNVKSELKVIMDEKEGLQIQAKVNKALKKTLRIQQELLEIAKCHIKGVPVQKKDVEREVRMMLIEQFGQEAMEHFGKEATEKSCIETEESEVRCHMSSSTLKIRNDRRIGNFYYVPLLINAQYKIFW